MSDKTTEQRFWEKVDKSGDCWNWTGAKSSNGYGAFRVNSNQHRSHRYSYELIYGAIPAGKHVCHHCDNKICVRVSHLFLGTQKDNADDRERKGRGNQVHGQEQGSAKLTEEKVKRIREEYSYGNTTMMELAKKNEVGRQTIFHAIHRNTWAHVV